MAAKKGRERNDARHPPLLLDAHVIGESDAQCRLQTEKRGGGGGSVRVNVQCTREVARRKVNAARVECCRHVRMPIHARVGHAKRSQVPRMRVPKERHDAHPALDGGGGNSLAARILLALITRAFRRQHRAEHDSLFGVHAHHARVLARRQAHARRGDRIEGDDTGATAAAHAVVSVRHRGDLIMQVAPIGVRGVHRVRAYDRAQLP